MASSSRKRAAANCSTLPIRNSPKTKDSAAHSHGNQSSQTRESSSNKSARTENKLKARSLPATNSSPCSHDCSHSCKPAQVKLPLRILQNRPTHHIQRCNDHPAARRNKRLAKLLKRNQLFILKSHKSHTRVPAPAMDKTKKAAAGPSPADNRQAVKASSPAAVSVASFDSVASVASSVSSSISGRERSEGSEDAASIATNITTPDLSDSETKPASGTVTAKTVTKPATSAAVSPTRLPQTKPTTTPTPSKAAQTDLAAGSESAPSSKKKKRAAEEDTTSKKRRATEQTPASPPSSKKLKSVSQPTCTPAISKSPPTCSPAITKKDSPAKPKSPALSKSALAIKNTPRISDSPPFDTPASRPKGEYFVSRVDEMLDDPLDFDDLVYTETRPKKAAANAKKFARFRKFQGPPIDLCMSGAVGLAEPNPSKSPKTPKREEDSGKGALVMSHSKKKGAESPKMAMSSPRVIKTPPMKSPKRAGVTGSLEDEDGGILVGLVPKGKKKYQSPGRSPRRGGRSPRLRRR